MSKKANSEAMDTPLFERHVFWLRVTSYYFPAADWNIFFKLAYYLYRIFWYTMTVGTCVLIIVDMCFKEVHSMTDIALNVLFLQIYFSITSRGIIFMGKNNEVDGLVKRIHTEFEMETVFPLKKKSMEQNIKYAKELAYYWMLFVIVAGSLMFGAPLITAKKSLPIELWLWYDWTPTITCVITMIFFFIDMQFAVLGSGNVDMLTALFSFLIAGQAQIIGANFEGIFENSLHSEGFSEDEIYQLLKYGVEMDNPVKRDLQHRMDKVIETESFKKKLYSNFVYCIEQHQRLLSFVKEFEDFVSPLLLIEVNCNFLYLIFMLFIFVTTDNRSLSIALTQFISGSIAQIFLINVLGDYVVENIDKLRHNVYNIPWYLCDSHFLKSFKIVQLCMFKSVHITAGKLIKMSLETFLEFMRRAFSFFTILRQMYND